MKVKELIEKLIDYPGELEIFIGNYCEKCDEVEAREVKSVFLEDSDSSDYFEKFRRNGLTGEICILIT